MAPFSRCKQRGIKPDVANKYIFKGQDITTDILFKIEQIVSILAEKGKLPFDDAYAAFVSSNTYDILKRTDNLYWAESAEFLVDEYYREQKAHRDIHAKKQESA